MSSTICVTCLLIRRLLGCRSGQFNIAGRARWPLGYLLELVDQIPQLVTVSFARVIWSFIFHVRLMGHRLEVWLLALIWEATERHCCLVLLIRKIGRLMLLGILNVTLHWASSGSGSCLSHHVSRDLDDETIGDSRCGC